MKKSFSILIAGVIVIAAASCTKEKETVIDESASMTTLSIKIADESGTKSTLAETDGAFAFSSGDQIKVYNGRAVAVGTTSTAANQAVFTIDGDYAIGVGGFVGFPASMVSEIDDGGVTFILPTSYEYSQVGGSDPDAAKVPCPMMGTYTPGENTVLKQVGAVIRFKVTNIKAGTLSFVFASNVTGKATVKSTPSGEGGGITSLTTPGSTITINNVPAVPGSVGDCIFITIPVPTGTVPNNILVTNEPSNASVSRFQSLTHETAPDALSRAGGYRWSLSPTDVPVQAFTINKGGDKVVLASGNLMAHISSYSSRVATADEWKFESYYGIVGVGENTGNYYLANKTEGVIEDMWVDLFRWQGESVDSEYRFRGMVNYNYSDGVAYDYFGNGVGESLYPNCWNTDVNNANPATNGGIHISNGGSYTWRMLTSSEWEYLLLQRSTSKLNGVDNARCARAKVNGLNGLLIFPDNIGSTWDTETMGDYPNDINRTNFYYDAMGVRQNRSATRYFSKVQAPETVSTYSADNMTAMANKGVVFLPCTGYISKDAISSNGDYGYYWTASGATNGDTDLKNMQRADYLNFNCDELSPVGGYDRRVGRAVRLARPFTE